MRPIFDTWNYNLRLMIFWDMNFDVAIYLKLFWQDTTSIISQLESVFCEILTNNDTAFCSQHFRQFLDECVIRLWLRCLYIPPGNGIAERCHGTVKKITAKMQCTIRWQFIGTMLCQKMTYRPQLLHLPIWYTATKSFGRLKFLLKIKQKPILIHSSLQFVLILCLNRECQDIYQLDSNIYWLDVNTN